MTGRRSPGARFGGLESAYRGVRDRALRAPIAGGLVRQVRARAVERAYRATLRYYAASAAPIASLESALVARGGDRLRRFRALDRRPRVLFVGTDELQDRAGILQALATVADVVPFTQADGTYGQVTRDGHLSLDLAEPLGRRVLDLARAAEAAGSPFDLLVGQMWDGYIDGAALTTLRERHGALVVNIAMDDRHAFAVRRLGRTIGTRGLVPHVDLAATAAPEAVGWYFAEGCPAMFLPEASDPGLFRPRPELGKRHDVCFVGLRYGIRERIVGALEAASIEVEARGTGWPHGRIATEDVPELFATSRIVLGIGTIGHSERLYALKMRDFDGPMSGSCYVTHANPDLGALFDVGREIAVYRDDADCVGLVRSLLEDGERRESIARAGRLRAERDHTWRRRFEDLLSVLRGIPGPGR